MRNASVSQRPSLNKPHHKLLTGATMDKYPIMLEDGKTIIFISDKSKEEETRLKYRMRALNNLVK